MLSFQSYEFGDVLVITLEEEVESDDKNPMAQRERLYRTIETRDDPRFAIDLGALNYMASSDIGFLVTVKRRIDVRKGKLVVFHVDPFIMEVLRTMRLDKLLNFAD